MLKNKKLYDLCSNQFCVKIVYYTTREVKSDPHVAYRFFIIPGPKIPHSRFEGGNESGTFSHGMVKQLFSALRPESANFLAAARNEVAAFRRRRAEK